MPPLLELHLAQHALLAKPEFCKQTSGPGVRFQDAGLDAVQIEHLEAVVDREAANFGSQAVVPSLLRREHDPDRGAAGAMVDLVEGDVAQTLVGLGVGDRPDDLVLPLAMALDPFGNVSPGIAGCESFQGADDVGIVLLGIQSLDVAGLRTPQDHVRTSKFILVAPRCFTSTAVGYASA